MEHRVDTQQAAEASRPPRRPRHLILCMLGGAAAAYALGVAIVLIVDNASLTGRPDNVFTYIFGLPLLIAIAGGVIGALVSVMTYAEEDDATVVRTDREGHVVLVHGDGEQETLPDREHAVH